MNYYNDNDPKKCAWLRTLIEDGLIPEGWVDERSISDIKPEELHGFRQHHFFAGIGGWALAFQLAGIVSTEEAASCSCPCQPFSQTGKGLGNADPRHLFPQFYRLACGFRFPRIFGEQVASPAGRVWVEGIRAAMEDLGYLFEWVDLCAAGVGAPQLRQRIYWVAYANAGNPTLTRDGGATQSPGLQSWVNVNRRSLTLRLADAQRSGEPGTQYVYGDGEQEESRRPQSELGRRGDILRMGDSDSAGPQGRHFSGHRRDERAPWATSVAILGRDGKARRIEPGIFPLADGIPDRVALIGGAGNAIVPLVAAEFIQACEEARYL